MTDDHQYPTQDSYGRPVRAVIGRTGQLLGYARNDSERRPEHIGAMSPTPEGAYPAGEPVRPGMPAPWLSPYEAEVRRALNARDGRRPMARPLTEAELAELWRPEHRDPVTGQPDGDPRDL